MMMQRRSLVWFAAHGLPVLKSEQFALKKIMNYFLKVKVNNNCI